MTIPLTTPGATDLTSLSFAFLGLAAVVAAFLITAIGLSTAVYLHRNRAVIARLRVGETDVRKPR